MYYYYLVRCWLGKPKCYRKYPPNGDQSYWFAMCKHCGRQAEMHY